MSVSIKRSQFQGLHLSHKPSFSTWKAEKQILTQGGNSRGWHLTKILYFQKLWRELDWQTIVCKFVYLPAFPFQYQVNNTDKEELSDF
jgi:hypothetical protein